MDSPKDAILQLKHEYHGQAGKTLQIQFKSVGHPEVHYLISSSPGEIPVQFNISNVYALPAGHYFSEKFNLKCNYHGYFLSDKDIDLLYNKSNLHLCPSTDSV